MVRESISLLDHAKEEIFMDERGSQAAMFSYYQKRLLTYYGAKPATMLEANLTEKEKELLLKLFSFDLKRIKELTKEDIFEYKLDSVLIDCARYFYPELWYCETEKFEKKMISFFNLIIVKTGIENLSSDILYECVYQQLPQLLDFLLQEGANPNVNCFNKSYSCIKSSALYELYREGNYFSKKLYFRMKKTLLDSRTDLRKKTSFHSVCRWE